MTSVVTDAETKAYFESHNNFGISSECIHYFVQGYLPTLDSDGKVLLEDKNKIFLSPNGNGGVYDSLNSSGVLKQLNA
jgi:UDP-N-acetylglucosamine pyrophosphorylase